jgi:hypothetical protein
MRETSSIRDRNWIATAVLELKKQVSIIATCTAMYIMKSIIIGLQTTDDGRGESDETSQLRNVSQHHCCRYHHKKLLVEQGLGQHPRAWERRCNLPALYRCHHCGGLLIPEQVQRHGCQRNLFISVSGLFLSFIEETALALMLPGLHAHFQ